MTSESEEMSGEEANARGLKTLESFLTTVRHSRSECKYSSFLLIL